jgi:hypothetical protein
MAVSQLQQVHGCARVDVVAQHIAADVTPGFEKRTECISYVG